MEVPVISVIIPSYNRADLIAETIESVIQQTFRDWELVIIDDHSSDDTMRIAERYAAADSRIRCSTRESAARGASVCRNEGVRRSQGDFLVFLDSDDLLTPSCLEYRLACMHEHGDNLDAFIFQTELFERVPGDMGVCINRLDFEDDLEHFLATDSIWFTTAPLWRRSSFLRVGGWNESLWWWEDWELFVRALLKGLSYHKVDVVDSYLRQARNCRFSMSGAPESSAYVRNSVLAVESGFACLSAGDVKYKRRKLFFRHLAFQRLANMGRHHSRKDSCVVARRLYHHGLLTWLDVLCILLLVCIEFIRAKLMGVSDSLRQFRFSEAESIVNSSVRNRWRAK